MIKCTLPKLLILLIFQSCVDNSESKNQTSIDAVKSGESSKKITPGNPNPAETTPPIVTTPTEPVVETVDQIQTSPEVQEQATTTTSTLVAKIVANRTIGVAPLAVFFDGTGSVDGAQVASSNFRLLNYSFDFGDNRGLTWSTNGKPKNTEVGGPFASHVFDNPGTYSIKLTVTNSSGVKSTASMSVTVQDPNTIYSGTNTVCVSVNSDFTGCPANAAKQISLPTGVQWNKKRVLLKAGQTFEAINIQDGNSGVLISSFGSGAKPIVAGVNVGAWRPQTKAFPNDIIVMGLNSKGGLHQCLGHRVLFYKNDTSIGANWESVNMGFGIENYWALSDPWRFVPQTDFYVAREIFFIENNAKGYNNNDYGLFGAGSRVAIVGNKFEGGTNSFHTIRITALERGFISHNIIPGPRSVGLHSLKIHSDGMKSYQDSLINPGDGINGWLSSRAVISNNTFGNTWGGDTSDWTVAICPQNDVYAEGLENFIIENNTFHKTLSTYPTSIVLGGRNLTTRKNVMAGTSTAASVQTNNHMAATPTNWRGPYYVSP